MSIICNWVHSERFRLSDKPRTNSQRNRSRKLLPNRMWVTLMLVATVLWAPFQVLAATTLDQAIKNLLDNDCENLAGGGGNNGIGSELNVICNIPNGGSDGASAGGGSGTAQSLAATIENRRNDRLEGKTTGNQATLNLPSGIGLYVSGNFEALDREQTTFSDGFDSTVLGATVGGDFRVNDRFLAGAAFNYINRDGDFDGGGNFTTNSYGLLAYASFMPTPATFLDISLGYTKHNYELERSVSFIEDPTGPGGVGNGPTRISGEADSDSDGHEVFIRAVSGSDHNFVSPIGSITVGPRIGFNYSQLTIDPYSESGGSGLALAYDEQSIRSLQSTIGVQGSIVINTSYGVWVPQANADYVHEFENDRRDITVNFVQDQRQTPTKFSFNNDKPDRNFFNFSVGTVLVLPHGIQPFFNFRVMAGHSQFDNYAGTVGVRIEGS